MGTDIAERKDVGKLVRTFYAKVRKDDLIGPIFNAVIPEDEWEAHLEKLTDFWEGNLFFRPLYKGNPILKHRAVDQEHGIGELHFQRWLGLWRGTVDELFEGAVAEDAKKRAESIAKILLVKLAAVGFRSQGPQG